MSRRRVIAIAFALLAFIPLASAGAAKISRAEGPTLALLRANYFSVWGVGYAATATANENMFRAFMEQKPSLEDARLLIQEGTPAGKIYGLLAIKKLSPEQFSNLAPKFLKQRNRVNVMRGCDPSPTTESTGKLVRRISDGDVILHQRRK